MAATSIYNNNSVVNWLESILRERFSDLLCLEYKNKNLVISLLDSSNSVVFDNLSHSFEFEEERIPFCELSFSYGDIKGKLPAPGLGEPLENLIKYSDENHIIKYDILGLAYWMLSRFEETKSQDLDKHRRFTSDASHAFKNGYLGRPLVDEWFVVLGRIFELQWPNLVLKKHNFEIKLSHDVDSPSLYAFKSWKRIFKTMIGHLLKRFDVVEFIKTPIVKLSSISSFSRFDNYNTFDWLMKISEKNKIRSSFYFISGKTNEKYDADYEIEHPLIRNLIKDISRRGHEIGLHPSYECYLRPEEIEREAERLRKVCLEEGLSQQIVGGRMHYLRWNHPKTMYGWERSSMVYDSTLGYADRPGFRCGTCFEYPAFDPIEKVQLKLRVRPLIAMECSVIDDVYMGLGCTNDALDTFLDLKEECRKVNGTFSLLWHNSYFQTKKHFEIYEKIVEM